MPGLKRIERKLKPSFGGGSLEFTHAVKHKLKENNKKFDGEIFLPERNNEKKPKIYYVQQAIGMAVLLVILMIFSTVPLLITEPLPVENAVALGIIESFITPVLLVFAMIFVVFFVIHDRKMPVKEYHGAEHKVIKCLKANDTLTAESIKKYKRYDAGCGTCLNTAAIVFAVAAAVLIFAFVPVESGLIRALIRAACYPPAFILANWLYTLYLHSSFTALKIIVHIIVFPGLLLQVLVITKEPTDKQLEVAGAAAAALVNMRQNLV